MPKSNVKQPEVDISSESEMPPIKKKDFFALVKNKDDIVEQRTRQVIKEKASKEILEKKLKHLETLYDASEKKRELLQKQVDNTNVKRGKGIEDYNQLLKKSRERAEFYEKNEQKLIQEEIERNHKSEYLEFLKKYNISE